MELSFIIPSYIGERHMSKLLLSFANQTDPNFEIIFVIDNAKGDKTLELLQKLNSKYKLNIKILFNSKRQKRITSIINGINKASGSYISISSTHDNISKDFVAKINKIAQQKKPDIIEYKFKYNKTKIIAPLNTPKNKLIKLKDDISIMANSIPFDFNKIIKKTIAKKIENFAYIDGASRFDVSYVFNVMINSETYYAIDDFLKTTQIFPKSLINPHRMMGLVKKEIDKYMFIANQDHINAILFFGWTALSVYQMQVLILAKNDLAISRLHSSLEKLKNLYGYKYASLHNKYFVENSLSTFLLDRYPNIDNYKKIIRKWDY